VRARTHLLRSSHAVMVRRCVQARTLLSVDVTAGAGGSAAQRLPGLRPTGSENRCHPGMPPVPHASKDV